MPPENGHPARFVASLVRFSLTRNPSIGIAEES